MKPQRAICAILLAATTLPAFAEGTIQCPVTADAWIDVPTYDTHESIKSPAYQNHGADIQLPIQGYVSFALFQFDVSALKGRSISQATLRVHRSNTDPVPLHTVGISTISGSGPWVEGTQKDGPAAQGPVNFYFARTGNQRWSYPGSDLVNVTFGQGGSLYAYRRTRDAGSGWYEIDIPPLMVSALVSGDQYGLMLCDEKGQTHANLLLDSRESPYRPVLWVEVGGEDNVPPGPVRTLKPGTGIVQSTPEEAWLLGRSTLRPGSIILKFGGAGDDRGQGVAAHYEVRYSDKPITETNFDPAPAVPRWSLDPLAPKPSPLATSNELRDQVTAVVEQLKP